MPGVPSVGTIVRRNGHAVGVGPDDALDQHAVRLVGIVGDDECASRHPATVAMGTDDHKVTGVECRFHAATAHPEPQRATECAEEADAGLSRAQPPASSHLTSRFLVAQKMLWMFSQAATRASASSSLIPTLQAEHSLAAFQNVSCRSG